MSTFDIMKIDKKNETWHLHVCANLSNERETLTTKFLYRHIFEDQYNLSIKLEFY